MGGEGGEEWEVEASRWLKWVSSRITFSVCMCVCVSQMGTQKYIYACMCERP